MMKVSVAAVLIAGLSFATGCTSTDMQRHDPMMSAAMTSRSMDTMLASWPETATKAARSAMETYGMPDEATPTMLVWHDSGPWKRTIVYKEEIQHDFPMPHKDVWEQSINYDVPVAMFDDLAMYDGSVIVERTKGEMSARCDKEGANFLAINLAHDIITGKRTVEEARSMYGATMKSVMQGEMPEYVRGFTFTPTARNITNPDQSIMKK